MLFDWCIQHVQYAQNGAFIARHACVKHKAPSPRESFTHLKRLFTGWKRLFMAWKDYLRIEKDYLRLWPGFFRIVSLFLITWCTFNQSLNKNIWMPYITGNDLWRISLWQSVSKVIHIEEKSNGSKRCPLWHSRQDRRWLWYVIVWMSSIHKIT